MRVATSSILQPLIPLTSNHHTATGGEREQLVVSCAFHIMLFGEAGSISETTERATTKKGFEL